MRMSSMPTLSANCRRGFARDAALRLITLLGLVNLATGHCAWSYRGGGVGRGYSFVAQNIFAYVYDALSSTNVRTPSNEYVEGGRGRLVP